MREIRLDKNSREDTIVAYRREESANAYCLQHRYSSEPAFHHIGSILAHKVKTLRNAHIFFEQGQASIININ